MGVVFLRDLQLVALPAGCGGGLSMSQSSDNTIQKNLQYGHNSIFQHFKDPSTLDQLRAAAGCRQAGEAVGYYILDWHVLQRTRDDGEVHYATTFTFQHHQEPTTCFGCPSSKTSSAKLRR